MDDVHRSGDMYKAVRADLPKYIHLNLGLEETLARLHDHGKLLCVVTNSPFAFMSVPSLPDAISCLAATRA